MGERTEEAEKTDSLASRCKEFAFVLNGYLEIWKRAGTHTGVEES